MENHRSKLDTLLFAEEIEMEEEMREFDMELVNHRLFIFHLSNEACHEIRDGPGQ